MSENIEVRPTISIYCGQPFYEVWRKISGESYYSRLDLDAEGKTTIQSGEVETRYDDITCEVGYTYEYGLAMVKRDGDQTDPPKQILHFFVDTFIPVESGTGAAEIRLSVKDSLAIKEISRSARGGDATSITTYEVLWSRNDKADASNIQTFVDYSCVPGITYYYQSIFWDEISLFGGGDTFTFKIKRQNIPLSSIEFDNIILYDNSTSGGCQVICFNPSISLVKRNLQESVTATLGSKYPIVRRNGDADYYTFSLGGLISTLADRPMHLYNANETNRTLVERQFRQQFVNSLTNGHVKLFKSGPEGLMLVRVTDVSLTPEPKLGRDIYSFSATVTEVAEATVDNLKEYGMYEPQSSYYAVKIDSDNNNNYYYFTVKGGEENG